jgi:hypothetical protein
MVTTGKWSFSLYPWHWPVFSLIDYRFYLFPFEMRLVLKIGLSLLLTIITFHFIETPARSLLNQPQSRRISFAIVTTLLVLCIPLGITICHNNYVNAELADLAKGGLVFPGKSNRPSVVLMGDSNGSMYGKAIKEICAGLCKDLTVISVAAGDPIPSMKGGIRQPLA